ncbi:hypothetical protein LHEJCM1005_07420 [Lactobacillus helveticus]|nr:hypothetical protein HMPREF0518_0314 [Lactobacillus helveticus DSM 20075 = CGMCC 1.1877]EGF37902.1 hypothetical protein AAULH_06496 [Lactobacillus helveticus MTCC 5463]GFP06450.1 hypothetical protein LHEJCM1005_07420 [Lactobacillus helveticus]CDI63497.1 Putative uncharacterized protein [Lactobacillus helveticus CIRM-BIA 103]
MLAQAALQLLRHSDLQAVRQKETQRNASGLSPLEFDAFDETPYVDFSEPPTAELLFL